MGSSVAGKTSLLNIISDRINLSNGSKRAGIVTLNDSSKRHSETFGAVGSYVMQDDILFHYFTAREALNFAARLKVKATREEQDKRVEDLLNEHGLKHVADTLIGYLLMKILSGGERKRFAIGVVLVTDPSIILLDEPTSDLDSFKALNIVKLFPILFSFKRNLHGKGKL